MNDITALALLVSKAKASVFTMKYISQFEASDIDSDDVDLRFEVDGVKTGTNVSIVDECGQAAQMITALVEALEAKDKQITDSESRVSRQNRHVCELFDDNTALRQRIAELEVESKTMLELRQAALADNAHLKLELDILESRTVTVKMPPRVDSSNVPFTAHTWNCCLDAVEKCLTAAGIQVIEGEQKNG